MTRVSHPQGFLCRGAKPKNSLLAIDLQRIFPENLGEFSRGEAPHDVHLPQPVLRRDVSLSKKHVLQGDSFDRRYPVPIARNDYGSRKPADLEPAIEFGKSRAGCEVGISGCARQRNNKGEGNPEEDSKAGETAVRPRGEAPTKHP